MKCLWANQAIQNCLSITKTEWYFHIHKKEYLKDRFWLKIGFCSSIQQPGIEVKLNWRIDLYAINEVNQISSIKLIFDPKNQWLHVHFQEMILLARSTCVKLDFQLSMDELCLRKHSIILQTHLCLNLAIFFWLDDSWLFCMHRNEHEIKFIL